MLALASSSPSREQQVRFLIDDIDLHMVKRKLLASDQGEDWTQEQVDRMEIQYRRFLFLCWKYSDRPIVPTKTIDTFWHQHILDTRAYAQDCERIFGGFIHHNPYFGMLGDDDRRANREAFARTQELWDTEFGETITGVGEDCCTPDYCRAGCGSITMRVPDCQPTA